MESPCTKCTVRIHTEALLLAYLELPEEQRKVPRDVALAATHTLAIMLYDVSSANLRHQLKVTQTQRSATCRTDDAPAYARPWLEELTKMVATTYGSH